MPCPAWYDITGLESRANETCEGLDESYDRIMKMCQEEIDFEGTRFHEEEASPGNIPPENLHDVDEAAYYFDILVDGEIE